MGGEWEQVDRLSGLCQQQKHGSQIQVKKAPRRRFAMDQTKMMMLVESRREGRWIVVEV